MALTGMLLVHPGSETMDASAYSPTTPDDEDNRDTAPSGAATAAPKGPQETARFVAISRSLQRIFGHVVEQPLPQRLVELIHEVDRRVSRRKDGR